MRVLRFVITFALVAVSLPARGQTPIEGLVLDESGKPVAGARIEAFEQERPDEAARRRAAGRARVSLATTRSGSDGAFQFQASPTVALIQASAEGFAPGMAEFPGEGAVELTLRRASRKLGVVSAGGRPVAGAQVTWISSEGAELQSRTGADGAFEAPDPEVAAGQVMVSHPNYAPTAGFASGSGAKALDQKIRAGVLLNGVVVDGTTKKAIPDADVWVDDRWFLSRTDASGNFSIANAPADWASVTARTRLSIGSVRRKNAPLRIAVGPGRRVSGAVVDAETRRPLAGATVTVGNASHEWISTRTDGRGEYAITGLPPGRFLAFASRAGYEGSSDKPPTFDLREARSERFDPALKRLPRIEGRVLDELRKPVEGALVALGIKDTPHIYSLAWLKQNGSVRTNRDGRFTLTVSAEEDGMPGFLKGRPLIVLKPGFAAARLALPPASPRPVPIEVTLTAGVELRGRITTPEGSPVPDASVSLAEEGSVGGSLMPTLNLLESLVDQGWTRSDQDGRFIVHVKAGPHHLLVRKAGFVPGVVRRYDPGDGRQVEVVLDRALALRGRITRPDGRGVEGVQAILAALGPMPTKAPGLAETSRDGSFEIGGLAAGVYRFTAQHEELGVIEARTVEVPGDELQIVLPAAVTLRGQVLEAATRKPVPNFTVALMSVDRLSRRLLKSDAADGSFALQDVAEGKMDLSIEAEGYSGKTIAGLVVEAGAEPPSIEVLMDPDAPIRGRVTDPSNAPVAEATVAVEKSPSEEPTSAPSEETDEEGEYELRGVPPGEITLSFTAPGFAPERRTIDTRRVSQLDVALKRGLTLKGLVVDEMGDAVKEAYVRAQSSAQGAADQTAQADEQGRFALDGLIPGRYSITATTRRGSGRLDDVDAATAGSLRLVVELAKTAILAGKVIGVPEGDEDGMSMVMASNEETGQSAQASLDASRSFRMEDAPTGRVRVQAVVASMTSGSTRMSRSVDLMLAPGSQTSTVLEFSNDITISGTVTKDGAPLPFAGVSFSGPQEVSTRTDARGAYQAVGLEPGSYKVNVQRESRWFTTPYVVSSTATLDIDVTGATIAGRIVRADGAAPVAGVEVSFFRVGVDENTPETSTATGSQGAFVERTLPEGRYRLITSKAGFGQEVREVEVPRGGTIETLIEVSPADGLSVSVVDARDQRPLEAIVVVRDQSRRIVATRHSGVGADGALNIPLSAGTYSLSTSATGYGTATLKVSAPGQGLKLGLTPGGTLIFESARDLRGRVRLIQPDGEEYVRCWCNGIADIELKGKRTVVPNITAGTYVVELVDDPGSTRPSVVVLEGQATTVVLP